MRVRRLDLTRYGHFTNFSIDFGPLQEGKPDLHVIFGPNEAGKTTAFEGYLDLLFGIPVRSSYNFLHEYDNMLVGGVLDIDGVSTEFNRIKKNRNDLLNLNGEPANPAILLHALSGITREQYRSMFSLNDETIEAGGEDILASQGNLGELLFSASAGLSDLAKVMDKVRAEVDAFHKPRAHKTTLNDAKNDIKRIESTIKELDTNANTFKLLLKAEKDARQKYEEVKVERDRLLSEKSLIEATLECLPLLPKLKIINEELLKLSDYPNIPDGLADEINALKERNEQAQSNKKQASDRHLTLSEKRDHLRRDPSILVIGEDLELLLDTPKSRAQTADEDLPTRRLDVEVLNANIDRGFKQLNFDDNVPEQMSEPLLRQMEDLANKWEAAQQSLNIARNEKKTAERKLARLIENDPLSEDDVGVDNDINQILGRIRPEALIEKFDKHNETVQRTNDKVAACIQDLFPWIGEVKNLPKNALTEDQAKRLADRWISLQNDMNKAQEAFDNAALKVNQLSARITEEENDKSLVSDKEAKHIQSKRDELWNRHISNMISNTAEPFHQAMMHCDTVHDARLATAERLARLREVQLNHVECVESRNHFQHKMTDIQKKIEAEHKVISIHLKALHLPETFDILDLPDWLKKLSTARAEVETLNREANELNKTKQEISCAEQTLRDALAVGPEFTLSALTSKARKSVEAIARQSERRVSRKKNIKEASEELEDRNKVKEELKSNVAAIEEAWQKLASNSPIFFKTSSEFRAALPTLREINGWITQREGFVQRINAMEQDYSSFANQIQEYAKTVGEDEKAHPLSLAKRLEKRLKDAELNEERYSELCREIEETAEKKGEADKELAAVAGDFKKKTEYFPASTCIETIEDLVAAVKKSERANSLRSDCTNLENRIVTRLGKSSIEAAQAFLAEKNIPEVQAQLDSLGQDCFQAEKDFERTVGDLRSAGDKLKSVGGDDAVVRLVEARQTVMLTVTDQAKQNLRLRLGLMAAEWALDRYREKHRSSMLLDTAKAFQTLTNGRYSDLQTQPNGQKEILLASRKDDKRTISVSDMSKGTRFQLYLALRLAGYRQFTSGGTTLPFIADDIMETFDNTRTSAAFDLLQQMALNGQALYFTHHEHVVDLAREKCGDSVTIHRLIAN